MFVEEIRRAVMVTPRTRLAEISSALWKGYAAGAISEDEAQSLTELIEARKMVPVAPPQPRRVGSRPRSSASMERRRAWTGSGWMPPSIASRFTMGEASALAVVLSEVAMKGSCDLCHGAVGGRAGVSVTTVKRALAQARRLGLVSIEERRVSRFRSMSNIVTVVSPELAAWVRTRGRGLQRAKAGGVQFGAAPKQQDSFLYGRNAWTERIAWKKKLCEGSVCKNRANLRNTTSHKKW